MKAKKAKEQLIAIALLSSVFIFFIYLKMNSAIDINSSNHIEMTKIIEQKIQAVELEIADSEAETTLLSTEETVISDLKEEEKSIILFTQIELKRAKAYLDKDWRPDDTINMAAWDYVAKNPNINNLKNEKEHQTLYLGSIQVANTTK